MLSYRHASLYNENSYLLDYLIPVMVLWCNHLDWACNSPIYAYDCELITAIDLTKVNWMFIEKINTSNPSRYIFFTSFDNH